MMSARLTTLIMFTVAFLANTSDLYAYGSMGGGGSVKCSPAILTKTQPEKLAVIQQGDQFSFEISKVFKKSISVIIKKLAAEIEITEKAANRFSVTGKIPAEAPNGYARINVNSKTTGNCASSAGWLVIIGEAESS